MKLWLNRLTETKKVPRMKGHHNMNGQHSRGDAHVRVLGWSSPTAASFVGVVPMLDTQTAKINPRGVSGGLPGEGNP